MNWTTLYITGRGDFREDVQKKLEASRIDIMPGYIDSSAGRGYYDLYWINEDVSLKEVKSAIGSKLVWKYRLRFHPNLEDFIQAVDKSPVSDLTPEDYDLMEAMRKSA
jgi:hypothetical protein